MNSDELEHLAAFQAAMLTTLHAGHDPAAIRASLSQAAAEAGLADYVKSFDDRMLVVAAELVRKWGARNEGQ